MRKIKAKELQITDRLITEPERGNRSWAIARIQRIPGERRSVQVWTSGHGTWNYEPNEIVAIAT